MLWEDDTNMYFVNLHMGEKYFNILISSILLGELFGEGDEKTLLDLVDLKHPVQSSISGSCQVLI